MKPVFKLRSKFELGVTSVTEDFVEYKDSITDAKQLAAIFRKLIPEDLLHYKEVGWAVYLNKANKVIACVQLSEGGLTGTVIDSRTVFQHGLMCNAAAFAICRNHPSGRAVPSETDKRLTEQLSKAGEIMMIELIDHIILTADGFYSFANQNSFDFV